MHILYKRVYFMTKVHWDWTCLWMKTTDPSRRHVPPCRSTWSMRRICRKRIPLMADVANTCPLEPTDSTTMEATTTIRSAISHSFNKNNIQIMSQTSISCSRSTARTGQLPRSLQVSSM